MTKADTRLEPREVPGKKHFNEIVLTKPC